jgi:PAS domain S-box-containing protein
MEWYVPFARNQSSQKPIRPVRWSIVVYSILLSEALTALACLLMGRFVTEFFILGFIVPLLVAPGLMYYSYSLREGLIDQLARSEDKFRTLFDSATDALLLQDMEGRLIDANRTAYESLGYTKDEMLAMDISALYPPESADRVLQMLERLREHEAVVFESTYVRRDGKLMPVEVHSRILEYDGRKVFFSDVRDITERKQAEHQLEAAFHEKEILMREIHHRVKNNMTVITSFLNLQAKYTDNEEVKSILSESRGRIRSMALVHEKLYLTGNLAKVDLEQYLRSLLQELFASYRLRIKNVNCSLDVEDVGLDIRTSLTCGLIINELVSNSMKYAFDGVESPEIRISLKSGDDALLLTACDNGCGIPGDVDINSGKTLGLQIVDSLVSQLDGTLELDNSEGAAFTVRFSAPQGFEA